MDRSSTYVDYYSLPKLGDTGGIPQEQDAIFVCSDRDRDPDDYIIKTEVMKFTSSDVSFLAKMASVSIQIVTNLTVL